ncbi:helix-turn-helix transcriptional regulator [Amycolatopsis sp. CA-230715]|uniref:helix-turn-helix transcriptional regulator n=1 Tax=Amycolatopsis sp. CA-230715 TaxID=2745196 RepID=UPI001C01E08F|nr:YafY family protein [Amycolatopsis sp. CA-230715]QWF84561.1 hypothetical protein HUW46_08011 [Amycolatopsis sp. CA-230715]
MRASRLLSLLLILQTRGRMTARELADELEVSVRTIYRDVESLHAAGVPLYGDAGHAGGYQLLDGYRTKLTGLTTDEAEALFLTGLPGAAAELGLGSVVAAARLKLTAALPRALRERAGRIQDCFHLDAPGWYSDGEHAPHLTAAASAAWDRRRVRVRYCRWQAPQEVTRVLDPYGMVLKGGRWYLVAACEASIRTYRVSQIRDLEVLDEPFEPPEGFDLARYWGAYLADFDRRRHTGKAEVLLSPTIVRTLPDLLDSAVVRAVDHTGTMTGTGWLHAVVPIESEARAVSDFLRLGAEIEVLGPASLRELMRETVASLARAYRTPQFGGERRAGAEPSPR